MPRSRKPTIAVETLRHEDARRKNIPTAEYQSVLEDETRHPIQVAYERRNPDLDPQLVWRGKDIVDWSDLVVHAPPLYIQEKIHPKALIDDLLRETRERREGTKEETLDLFADFNGIPEGVDRTEFYQHDQNWTNRMILGDSLQVMASLAEREGLRGQVQCIYFDPPYGIKFNSNFQWSTTSRDVKDGNAAHITREPEQVKAFRDTWRDGIHSYLTYLRDRLTIARELLTESGSIFVQIGDDNVHRVRAVMDEVFGEENFVSQILYRRGGFQTDGALPNTFDFILWYAKNQRSMKFRRLFIEIPKSEWYLGQDRWVEFADGRVTKFDGTDDVPEDARLHSHRAVYSASGSDSSRFPVIFNGKSYYPPTTRGWSTNTDGFRRLMAANRLLALGRSLRYKPYYSDSPFEVLTNGWMDTVTSGFGEDKIYVVQTSSSIVQRCILMTTDPGDLVLDPTCGSGTTAYVAEQWGRRWITIDTSRVALALARARIMGARFPYYLLADSPEGQKKIAEITGTVPSSHPTTGNIRHGFVYERVPHITLKSIANNAEIDVLWEKWQPQVQAALDRLNAALRGHPKPFRVTTGGREGQEVRFDAPDGASFTLPSGEVVKVYELAEWEVPREAPADWPEAARQALEAFWRARIARQREIDASIAANAEYEYLYDRPYVDNKVVRVAGPFTVESLSPHRVLGVDENDELIDLVREPGTEYGATQSFPQMVLEHLRTAGVQQAHKDARIVFTSLVPWPGDLICAEGRYVEGADEDGNGGVERRAAIFIGPEFGTVTRPDLVEAAREAADAGFDVLIACAFNFDAHTTEFNKLGRVPVLKARMNADLHMADELKNNGKGNLFVVFGEPDIDLIEEPDGRIRVKVNGVDVFHPQTGEIRSDGPDGIACWFIDTDYNEESFFVRHAYFLGAGDPYKALKTTLKAEIDPEAWASLYSAVSRPFERPKSGRIAVKVINHLGDEVMKVFRVG